MASLTSGTSYQNNIGAGEIAALHSVCATQKARLRAGAPVTGDTLATLAGLYNSFVGHTHILTDVKSQKGFGTSPTPYSATQEGTSAVVGAAYLTNITQSTNLTGQTVSASLINTMVGAINRIRSHYHTWTDDSY